MAVEIVDVVPSWKTRWEIRKYAEGVDPEKGTPYAVSVIEGNIMLDTGKAEMWALAIGGSANNFDNTNAQIGVGDSTTAESSSQTDLVAATNKTYKAADATYPTQSTTTTTDDTFKTQSTFGGADANYAWQEFVIKQATSLICLNRKVSNQGTKASGQTWVISCTIALA